MKMMGPTNFSVILCSKTIEQEPYEMYFCKRAIGLKENRVAHDTYAVMKLSYKGMVTYLPNRAEFCLISRPVLSQEIPCIVWNPKVHYGVYKCRPPIPILWWASGFC
jgi:hypothetical protein